MQLNKHSVNHSIRFSTVIYKFLTVPFLYYFHTTSTKLTNVSMAYKTVPWYTDCFVVVGVVVINFFLVDMEL